MCIKCRVASSIALDVTGESNPRYNHNFLSPWQTIVKTTLMKKFRKDETFSIIRSPNQDGHNLTFERFTPHPLQGNVRNFITIQDAK